MTLYGQGNGLHKATLTISNGLSYDGKKSNYPSSGVKSRRQKTHKDHHTGWTTAMPDMLKYKCCCVNVFGN